MLIFIFVCLTYSQAYLRILSPDSLKFNLLEFEIAEFGDPLFMMKYGKFYFLDENNSCTVNNNLPPNSLVVVTQKPPNCYFSDLALSIQQAGGKGFIYIFNLTSANSLIMAPKTFEDGISIQIFAISTTHEMFSEILTYKNITIWATVQCEFISIANPKIYFVMSTNYQMNLIFLNEIIELNLILDLSVEDFEILLSFVTYNMVGINKTNDCLQDTNNLQYCEYSSSSISGKELLLNGLKIINFYYSLPQETSIANFLTFLRTLFIECSWNLSQTCINTYFSQTSTTINTDLSGLVYTSESNIPIFFYIGIHKVFAPSFFQYSYCSISLSNSSYCLCNNNCKYIDLSNQVCNADCNVSLCGYQALECLKVSANCYSFMLGDGNCNTECPNDPDCKSDYCNEGCQYSVMRSGLCPLACAGLCFEHCSHSYCSPECLYSDFSQGNCSLLCSDQCYNNCTATQCSEGCTFTQMQNGNCPASCNGNCFNKCSKNFCSPGCKFTDLSIGMCKGCSQSCLPFCGCDLNCLVVFNLTNKCPYGCSNVCCGIILNQESNDQIVYITAIIGGLM